MTVELHKGDCRDWLPLVPDASVDAVITDPPYPCIDRPYGKLTEAEWWELIVEGVIPQVRRILKPTGSAVFILQPNSRKVGSMRGWLFEFQAWACREWNMVQDAWWWNVGALPMANVRFGLLRPSLKACVWLGFPGCYRDQDSVLDVESAANRSDRIDGGKRHRRARMASRVRSETEGPRDDYQRLRSAALERGGVTPFNVRALGSDGRWNGGTHGHGASTPLALASWWTRYLVPKDESSVVCDPFMGSGTMALAALSHGASFAGGDKMPEYVAIARRRIDAMEAETPLFSGAVP